jgi:hypothetical protein
MRKLMLALVICAVGIAPAAAAAEPLTLIQANPPAATADLVQGKLLAIGTGIILGAAAGSLVTLRGAALVGAIAGGLIGAWWYGNHSDIAPLEPRKR